MPFEVTADPAALSYASVADAQSVVDARGGGAAFLALADDATRLQYLTAASLDLDTSDWIGERATAEQEREWPRTGTAYSDDALPGMLIDATIELAFANAAKVAADPTVDVLNPSPDRLKRKKVGPIEREWFAPETTDATAVARFPTIVQALIARLIRDAESGVWGSGYVVRGS